MSEVHHDGSALLTDLSNVVCLLFTEEACVHGSLFRHVGDLGNVMVTDGEVHTTITDNVVSLYGPLTVIGRSILVCIHI